MIILRGKMEEVYCPRCKEPVGFPFMKCPECNWYTMGNHIEKRKILAERYISEDPEHEDQDRLVYDMVLSEVLKREDIEGKRRIEEYKRLSWFTLRKYLISIPILIIAPYILFFIGAGQGVGGGAWDDFTELVIYCTISSVFLIAISTFLFFLSKTRLFIMDRKK